jgi:phosphoglycerate dehydrogenase-like enzyme
MPVLTASPATAVVCLAPGDWTERLRGRLAPLPVITPSRGGCAPEGAVAVSGYRAPDEATGWREFAAPAGWVHFIPAGIDGFPLDWLQGRTVTCSRGVNADQIAEYVVAMILAAEKRLPQQWSELSSADVQTAPLGRCEGKTIGLVGFGAIGQAVARRLQGFGVQLVAARRTTAPADVSGVEIAPLARVFAAADHLVLATPLTPSTEGLLNATAFAQLKPGVHVVNIARGKLIDHHALLDAIDSGIVARASLDATHPEPLPADHPLRQRPEVVITPHVSWSAPDNFERSLERFFANLRRWNSGAPLEGLVNLQAGY